MTTTTPSRRGAFKLEEINRMAARERKYAKRRSELRDEMKMSDDPMKNLAVTMAEFGWGAAPIANRTKIARELADVLVLGRCP